MAWSVLGAAKLMPFLKFLKHTRENKRDKETYTSAAGTTDKLWASLKKKNFFVL